MMDEDYKNLVLNVTPESDGYINVGTDVVSINRIEDMIDNYGNSFLTRVYTQTEREYCNSHPSPSKHFAGRWAAKEAIIKILSVDAPSRPISFQDFEIQPSEGPPTVNLSERGKCVLRESIPDRYRYEKIQLRVSITHDRKTDIAASTTVLFVPKE